MFCEPETDSHKNIKKTVLSNVTICLEHADGRRTDFILKVLTFTLILMKVYS